GSYAASHHVCPQLSGKTDTHCTEVKIHPATGGFPLVRRTLWRGSIPHSGGHGPSAHRRRCCGSIEKKLRHPRVSCPGGAGRCHPLCQIPGHGESQGIHADSVCLGGILWVVGPGRPQPLPWAILHRERRGDRCPAYQNSLKNWRTASAKNLTAGTSGIRPSCP